MKASIDDLLTLAREGTRVEDLESVDIAEITQNCWRNVDTAETSLALDTDRVSWADQSVQHLLANLMRNAVGHGIEGVTVTTGDIDDDGCYVEDDGRGFPKISANRLGSDGNVTPAEPGTVRRRHWVPSGDTNRSS